ncbi:MAG TPA: L-threonylcarbamoyladenylate synthase [Candidatus Binatia bacterium]|jgi:L-threonylcarbamoyladenylate synthase|nr:L-threonylcarbamoyladenylate synthase [Candidatus Binatia bacterium]
MLKTNSLNDPKLLSLIQSGAVGVLPTDTVYGLAGLASNKMAVKRLYQLKSRDHKPGTVVAANLEQLETLGIKHRYLKAVKQFWPGPISIEIPHQLEYLHQGTGREAFRIPEAKSFLKLLQITGPLLTSSANLPGEPVASNIQEAEEYFGSKLDFYVDGGDLSGRPPSTIIRIIDDAIEVIRQGAVSIDPITQRVIK